MRSYDEMVADAMKQRASMLTEGRDPETGVFVCSAAEKVLILDKPPFMVLGLNETRDRICGLKIATL